MKLYNDLDIWPCLIAMQKKKFSLQFLPRYFYNYFVLVNVYLMQNIKKKPIEI